MKLKSLSLGLVLAVAAGAAFAAAPDGKPEERVEERVVIVGGPGGPGRGHGAMDANKDGVVTREEFRAMHDKMFDRLDKDRDGRLEDGEFGDRIMFEERIDGPGGPHGPGGFHGRHPDCEKEAKCDIKIVRHGEGLDADKDGRISFEEFAGPMKEHFKEMDSNRNGYLDGDEMKGDRPFMIRRVEKKEG